MYPNRRPFFPAGQAISRMGAAVMAYALTSGSVALAETRYETGDGPGQLGVMSLSEEECVGPQSIRYDQAGSPLVLDVVNRRIADLSARSDLAQIPDAAVDPIDFILTNRRAIYLDGAQRSIVELAEGAAPVVTTLDASADARQFVVAGPDISILLVDGTIVPTGLRLSDGEELRAAGSEEFSVERLSPNAVRISFPARGITLELESDYQLLGARTVSAADGTSLYVLVEELQISPFPLALRKLVRLGDDGKATGEAYLDQAGDCAINVDVAVDRSGTAQLMSVREPTEGGGPVVVVAPVEMTGVAVSTSQGQADDLREVSSEEADLSRFLENYNGTLDIMTVSPTLSPITRSSILSRAREAYDLRWTLGSSNHSRPGIENLCQPASGKYWKQPPRLTGMTGRTVKSVPYRWGGYYRELVTFQKKLDLGLLAGDVCTCRESRYNYCIVDQSAGLDCSGFVSLAWNMPYLTTSSLSQFATIGWNDLRPADAVNKRGSHVRLVTGIRESARGRLVQVLESAVTCDGVCEREYTQHELIAGGYKPIRRPSIQGE